MATYFLKTTNAAYFIRQNEDGSLFITKDGTTSIQNAGMFINNMGGIQAIIDRSTEMSESDFLAYLDQCKQARKNSLVNQAQAAERKRIDAQKALSDLLTANDGIIPATIDNLRTLLAALNTQNWGSWSLPKMSISYSCNQYDCDGRTATTIILDEPVDGTTRFSFGAPRGHLTNYRSL